MDHDREEQKGGSHTWTSNHSLGLIAHLDRKLGERLDHKPGRIAPLVHELRPIAHLRPRAGTGSWTERSQTEGGGTAGWITPLDTWRIAG